MKSAFLIIALTCLFLQSEARLFRGNFLGDQDPHDMAGYPQNEQGNVEDSVPHERAKGDGVAHTAAILAKELSDGIRKDFEFIKSTLTQFADEDGFVREGIVFCGSGSQTKPTHYNADTGLLSLGDGYKKSSCSDCEDGSVVALLANRIGAMGYRVNHEDLCTAVATTGKTGARTCDLKRNTYVRKSVSCAGTDVSNDGVQLDQYLKDEECLGKQAADCTTSLDCHYDAIEEICVSEYDVVKSSNFCAAGSDKSTEDIAADALSDKNAVRRNFLFSIKSPGSVGATNKVYVTGAVNGCKDLFDYVAALNGMAQISAFRDVGIEETTQNWNNVIRETRTYIESYANILSDFYDKSIEMFPLVEYEEFEECPAGDIDKLDDDLGTKAEPLCDQGSYNTQTTFNAMTYESQNILRSKCFCRKGKQLGGSNIPTATETYEADEFYLTYVPPNNCTVFNSDNDHLQSVYQFCKMQMLEGAKWKHVLTGLEPKERDIHTYGGSKADIRVNVGATLPLVADNYVPTCGRIVSSDPDQLKYSNKGGNCVPFSKMNDLLYRLEFETSQYNSGTMRDETPQTFEETFCNTGERLANTQFTFRQLAYQWDHSRAKASGEVPTSPLENEDPSDWNFVAQISSAQNIADQLFSHPNDKQMCNIDWTREITGEMSRTDATGFKYMNPYELFDREIGEAIFATEVAQLSKEKALVHNKRLWKDFKEALTERGTGTLMDTVANEAAEHFMKILKN